MSDANAKPYGFATWISRHFVSLTANYIALDANGQHVGEPKHFACSGFVISIHDVWFFVTAGHVLKEELDENIERKRIKLLSSSWVDYLGPNAKVHEPTPFEYEDQPRLYLDDRKLGLDFGLILLRPLFRDGMAANGVVPIVEENWIHQHTLDFQLYKMLGLNPALPPVRTTVGDGFVKIESSFQTVLVNVERLQSIPEDVVAPDNPWFVGRVGSAEALPSIKGMSGGPIFGFRQLPEKNNQWAYWTVALQSWWFPERRIIFGCSVPVFAGMVASMMEDESLSNPES